MPYIAINASIEMTDGQKDKIKAELGRLISIIPTKNEAGTFVDFSCCRTMYKAGEKISGAFIELRLFHKSDFEAKKKFTEEVFELLSRELGFKKEHMYLNIMEFENWGSAGTLRS